MYTFIILKDPVMPFKFQDIVRIYTHTNTQKADLNTNKLRIKNRRNFQALCVKRLKRKQV